MCAIACDVSTSIITEPTASAFPHSPIGHVRIPCFRYRTEPSLGVIPAFGKRTSASSQCVLPPSVAATKPE